MNVHIPPFGKHIYNSLNYWHEQIASSRQWRRQYSKIDYWPRLMSIYEQNEIPSEDHPYFNLIYSLASMFVPNTVFHTPHILNTPRQPQYATWARMFDAIDNALLDESRLHSILRRAMLELFLKNLIGIELNYDFPEMFEINQREIELGFPRTPGTLDHTRRINYPWFDYIPPERLLLSVGTRDKYTMRWWAKEITRPTRVLKNLHPEINKDAVTTNRIHEDIAKIPGQRLEDIDKGEDGYTTYLEIHNNETQEWGWLACNGTDWILPLRPDPMQIDGPSLEIVTMNQGSSSIWGTPTAYYILSQNTEINECKEDAWIHRKQSLLRIVGDAAFWTEEKCVEFLKSGPVGFIRLDMNSAAPDKAISETFTELQPHVPRDFPEWIDRSRDEAQFLASVGPNQAGMVAPGRRTKAEIQLVDVVSGQKRGLVRQDVGDMIAAHVNRFNSIINQNWKTTQIRKVIGIDGALYWVQANPVDFRDVSQQLVSKVNVDSLAPASRDQRRQEMVDVLGVLSKFKGMESAIFPIVMQLLSSYEWSSVHNALPIANNQSQPMPIQDFQAQQQQIASQPQTLDNLQQNMNLAQPALLNSLPA